MATRYPAEFRERAVELARLREKPVKQIAGDLGVSGQTLRNWDNLGKLKPYRHPMNNYRLYKKTELVKILKSIKKK